MKKLIIVLTLLTSVIFLIIAPIFISFPLRIIYNPSPSAPIGFYKIIAVNNLKRGDYIIIPTPPDFRLMAAKRQYLPLNVPLIKQVFGIFEDEICRYNESIFINKKLIAKALKYDNKNRLLPVWQGCMFLKENQLFALMNNPNSFDGRYFGALNTSDIIGIAMPIFTWKSDEK